MGYNSWWWWWMAFMLCFLITPIGYGWGYRGWGAPYPSYIQRRRWQRATAAGGWSDFNHRAWGWTGDLIWMSLIIGMLWAVAVVWLAWR